MENEEIREAEISEVKIDKEKRIKNLISLAVLLGGLFVGSLFIDVFQMVRGEGFSQRVLNKSDVFALGGKTWVAYSEPLIKVEVLMDDSCEACNPEEAIVGLKRELPTILTQKVDVNSEAGKKLLSDVGIKTIPAFIFSKEIENAALFAQAKAVFEQKGDKYLLNSAAVGLPVGKYIETPKIEEQDMKVGLDDAKVKIVQFSDFQCPYCRQMHETVITKILKEYGDKVQFVFKNFPLSFHAQAENASLAAQCASEQGKFIEYGNKLFATQDTWGKVKDASSIFKGYASQLGLKYNEFSQCFDSKKYADKIKSDTEYGQSFGISGTPGTFVNGEFRSGLVQYDEFKALVDAELTK